MENFTLKTASTETIINDNDIIIKNENSISNNNTKNDQKTMLMFETSTPMFKSMFTNIFNSSNNNNNNSNDNNIFTQINVLSTSGLKQDVLEEHPSNDIETEDSNKHKTIDSNSQCKALENIHTKILTSLEQKESKKNILKKFQDMIQEESYHSKVPQKFITSNTFRLNIAYQRAKSIYDTSQQDQMKKQQEVSQKALLSNNKNAMLYLLSTTFQINTDAVSSLLANNGNDVIKTTQLLLSKKMNENTIQIANNIRAEDCANCHNRLANMLNVPCGHISYCDKCVNRSNNNNIDHPSSMICHACDKPILKQVKICSTKVKCKICDISVDNSFIFRTTENCSHHICVPCSTNYFRQSLEDRSNFITKDGLKCVDPDCKCFITLEKLSQLQMLSHLFDRALTAYHGELRFFEPTSVKKHIHPLRLCVKPLPNGERWQCTSCKSYWRKNSDSNEMLRYECGTEVSPQSSVLYCETCFCKIGRDQSSTFRLHKEAALNDECFMYWKSKKSGKYKPIKGKELMKFHKFVEEEKIPVECRAFCPACSMCCRIDPPHLITKAKKKSYLNDDLDNLCLDKLFSNGNNELDDEETKGEDVQHFFCDYDCRFFGSYEEVVLHEETCTKNPMFALKTKLKHVEKTNGRNTTSLTNVLKDISDDEHKSDDFDLIRAALKTGNKGNIPGIEEVNMFKDDGTVIHFKHPKVEKSIQSNAYVVNGHGEKKYNGLKKGLSMKFFDTNNDIIKLQLNEATGKMDMYINPIDNDSPCAVEGVELSKSGRPVVGEPNKFVRSKMQHDQYKHRNMPVFINSVNTIKAIGTQNLNYEMVVDMVVEASNLVIDEEGFPGNIGFVPKSTVAQAMQRSIINDKEISNLLGQMFNTEKSGAVMSELRDKIYANLQNENAFTIRFVPRDVLELVDLLLDRIYNDNIDKLQRPRLGLTMSHQQIGALFTVKIDENNTIVVASVTEPELSYLSGWRITHVNGKDLPRMKGGESNYQYLGRIQRLFVELFFPPQQENATSANVFVTFEQNLRKVDKKKRVEKYIIPRSTLIGSADVEDKDQITDRIFNFSKLLEPYKCKHCTRGQICKLCHMPYHPGSSCEEYQQFSKSDTGKFLNLTSKPCPKCSIRTTKYHGHGCHHIRPGGGCSNCHHHWCFVCSGNFETCNCPFEGSSSCKNRDIMDHLDETIEWPTDKRCGCQICPDCSPDAPCEQCEGECVVCTEVVSMRELAKKYPLYKIHTKDTLKNKSIKSLSERSSKWERTTIDDIKELCSGDYKKLIEHGSIDTHPLAIALEHDCGVDFFIEMLEFIKESAMEHVFDAEHAENTWFLYIKWKQQKTPLHICVEWAQDQCQCESCGERTSDLISRVLDVCSFWVLSKDMRHLTPEALASTSSTTLEKVASMLKREKECKMKNWQELAEKIPALLPLLPPKSIPSKVNFKVGTTASMRKTIKKRKKKRVKDRWTSKSPSPENETLKVSSSEPTWRIKKTDNVLFTPSEPTMAKIINDSTPMFQISSNAPTPSKASPPMPPEDKPIAFNFGNVKNHFSNVPFTFGRSMDNEFKTALSVPLPDDDDDIMSSGSDDL